MHSLTAFLLATILALAIAPAPQSQQKSPPEEKMGCGTVVTPGQLKAELTRQAELARENSAAPAMAPPTDAPYYLPMTIHKVLPIDGSWPDQLPLYRLNVVMQELNRMWAQVGIQFFVYGEVDLIRDDDYFQPTSDRSKLDELRQINVVPNTINVYFTNLYGICGMSSFVDSEVQGVVLDYNCVVYGIDETTFAHEMGHYFDLYHTHEAYSFGVECPNGSNCSTAGDLVCDTPADPQLLPPSTYEPSEYKVDVNCVYDNSDATPANCDNTPYNPPTRNLMSFSRKTCRDQFTAGQISRVLQVLRTTANRKDLMTNGSRYVDPLVSPFSTTCTYDRPCSTVASAVQAAQSGDFIFLKPGAHQASSLGGKQVTLNRWGTAGVAELRP